MTRSDSIVAVAVVQFLGSLVALVLPALILIDEIQLYRRYPHTYQSQPARYYVVLFAIPVCLSLLGIFTSIGIYRLRPWARIVTIVFSIVPAVGGGLFLIFHHARDTGGALFVIGDFSNLFVGCLLVIVVPLGSWWMILFTRPNIRAQFLNR